MACLDGDLQRQDGPRHPLQGLGLALMGLRESLDKGGVPTPHILQVQYSFCSAKCSCSVVQPLEELKMKLLQPYSQYYLSITMEGCDLSSFRHHRCANNQSSQDQLACVLPTYALVPNCWVRGTVWGHYISISSAVVSSTRCKRTPPPPFGGRLPLLLLSLQEIPGERARFG